MYLYLHLGALYLSESMKFSGNNDKISEFNDKKSYILNSIQAFEDDLKEHPHNIWYEICGYIIVYLYVHKFDICA
jgi:hypothetical protein